jgi:IS30 family transposase
VVRGPLTVEQQVAVWDLSRQGWPFSRVARHLGRSPSTVRQYVRATGGVRPRPPKRREEHLRQEEREEISRGLAANESYRCIAARLDRSPSTICREIARNGGRRHYRAARADAAARERARRPKRCKLAANPLLAAAVEEKLRLQWSPQQIARRLREDYPNTPEMWVSHETIYLSLFVQSRGALRKQLTADLRTRRTMRHAGRQSDRGQGRGKIVDAIPISERPAEVNDRAVPGHWEGDMLGGAANTWIATLVERQTRFVMLVKLEGKSTRRVIDALTAKVQELPDQLMKSLTWDRGLEMADHKRFTVDTGVTVYFADPKSPWQRGSNENTNGLLRQYFPHGTNFRPITQAHLDEVAARLNGRPRQTLGWRTPSEKLSELLL